MKTLYELYRENMIAAGGAFKTGDSIYLMLFKWVDSEGGNARVGDTKNMLLQKLARARGATPYPGDSDVLILRRIVSGKPSDNEWWCLYKMTAVEVGLTPAPVLADDGGGVVSWLFAPGDFPVGSDSIQFQSSPDGISGWTVMDALPINDGYGYIGENVHLRARFYTAPGTAFSEFSAVMLTSS